MKISAVIIAKNEEKMIGDCLDSVSFCDEIIVVDNNSSDKTSEIATEKGIRVVQFESDDFAKLRNFGKELTNYEWILYIDADERVTDELKQSILSKTKNVGEFSAYKIFRKNYYLGRNEWPKIEKMERLFLKSNLKTWQGKLHESPMVEGRIGELSGFLLHFTHRDLTQMLNKTIEWSDTEARERFSRNHPKMSWWRFLRVMVTSFLKSYIFERGFRLGTAGLIEAMYQSYSSFITYAKLWEMQEKQNHKN